MSHNQFSMPATDGAGLGVGAAESTRYRLCLIRTGAQDVADFLTARELAGRVDHAMGATSVVLVDTHFRPLYWDESTAAQLAAATGQTVELIGGELSNGAPAPRQTPLQQVGLTVNPEGAAQPMSAGQLRAAAAAVPGHVALGDRWLVLGRVPGRIDLATTIESELAGAGGVQAHLWQEDGWFLAELVTSHEALAASDEVIAPRVAGPDPVGPDPDGADLAGAAGADLAGADGADLAGADPVGASPVAGDERPVLAASIAAALTGRDPVVVVRHGSAGTAVMQPGARRWSEFVLQWGLQRMWIHPRWGVAAVDQDNQVGAFAKEWVRTGGEVNEVNLRALSRRQFLNKQALELVLDCLKMPRAIVDIAVALPSGIALSPPQVLAGCSSQRPRRRAEGSRHLDLRAVALRGLCFTAAVAGCLLAYRVISAGLSGWSWAALGGASLLALGAVAGAVRVRPFRTCGARPSLGTAEADAIASEIVIDLAEATTQQDQPQH